MKKLSQEEAAKVLEDMKVKIEIPKAAVTQWKRNTALDIAIEALKHSEVPNSSDCISRQAAIEATWKEPTYTDPLNVLTEVRDRIKALPPAQPEIVRCKDCKWKQGSECVRFAEVRPFPDDFCSRAERRTDE